jgi:hypothetical protein
VNPRPVTFAGVERPNTEDPAWLRADLMREHEAVKRGFGAVSQRFVPRSLPVTMGPATFSAASWDFVIAADGGTIYLPKLTAADDGDEIKVGIVSGAVTVVSDAGDPIVGTATVTGPSVSVFTWAGAAWWVS